MNETQERYLMIPAAYLECGLLIIGVIGIAFGLLAFIKPEAPLRFYQWTMSLIRWRVEPEDEIVELRNTRIMGALMVPMSIIIIVMLQRW